MEPIGDLVAATLRRLGREHELLEPRCIIAWAEVAGPRVAGRSAAERLKDGVLTVRVDGAAWLQELSYLKRELRQRLNARLGAAVVREIRLLPGRAPKAPAAAPQATAPAPEPPPPRVDPAVEAKVRAEAATLTDPALREAIIALRLKLAGSPGRR